MRSGDGPVSPNPGKSRRTTRRLSHSALDRRDVIAGTAGPERVASATSGPVYLSVSSLVSGMFMRMMIRRTMTTMIMINSS